MAYTSTDQKSVTAPEKLLTGGFKWGLFVLGGAQYNLVQRVGQYAIFTECAGADRLNAVELGIALIAGLKSGRGDDQAIGHIGPPALLNIDVGAIIGFQG